MDAQAVAFGGPYAHSANVRGCRQLLTEHLEEVAQLAKELSSPFGGGDLSYLAGLWHDVGKAHPRWQELLIDCEQGVRSRVGKDHKCAGALLAEKFDGQGGIVGMLIHAHHGGLKSPETYRSWVAQMRRSPDPSEAVRIMEQLMPGISEPCAAVVPEFIKDDPVEAEMFLRLCYSALVDADSLDTEQHHLGRAEVDRGSCVGLGELWARYQTFLDEQPVSGGMVNRIRREVYESCIQAAEFSPGLFRLTVPTGGGKTRSALAFALRHGIKHDMRRVIVAVPFLTIIEQTADVYRTILENSQHDRVVLEHHSMADAFGEDEGFARDDVWRRLTADNWDAPVVITTTVQLFESLFSNKRSATRKLHNIANSVIVLDEAQALPYGLLDPVLSVLTQLINRYGVTVVLCTATQPAFEAIAGFQWLAPTEIVQDHPRHFEALRDRVSYHWRLEERTSWSEVARWMGSEPQALAIVNTKRHAMELLDQIEDPAVLHLSTLMCAAHRKQTVETIRRRLLSGDSCRVVSTQVVEAGVDLDFPAVFRSEAPLDAIIQAAGRCNREGTQGMPGRVVVFAPPDDAIPPGVYRSGRDIARVVRSLGNLDPNELHTVGAYFEMLFGLAVNSDEHNIQALRRNLDYPRVADRFRMIPDDTYDVAVGYPPGDTSFLDRALDDLRHGRGSPRRIRRLLQPYIVAVRSFEAQRLKRKGLIDEIIPGLGRWDGQYDPVRGIVETDPEWII